MDLEEFTAAAQLHHLESSCRITTCSLREWKLQMFLSSFLTGWLQENKFFFMEFMLELQKAIA